VQAQVKAKVKEGRMEKPVGEAKVSGFHSGESPEAVAAGLVVVSCWDIT
jgi:hypothetical protein